MIYMLRPSGRVPGVTMPGMSTPGSVTAGNPVLVLILTLFMLGYVLWTTDRLASLSRAGAAVSRGGDQGRQPAAATLPASAIPRSSGARTAADVDPVIGRTLAPRTAAGYKIAMSIAMGYMLVMML
jgi:hypothetical protein